MAKQIMNKTRINLHVYVTVDGRLAYHVLHVGFWPRNIASYVAAGLDARGLAFHCDVENQTGRVDVAICHVTSHGSADSFEPEEIMINQRYEAPRAYERESV